MYAVRVSEWVSLLAATLCGPTYSAPFFFLSSHYIVCCCFFVSLTRWPAIWFVFVIHSMEKRVAAQSMCVCVCMITCTVCYQKKLSTRMSVYVYVSARQTNDLCCAWCVVGCRAYRLDATYTVHVSSTNAVSMYAIFLFFLCIYVFMYRVAFLQAVSAPNVDKVLQYSHTHTQTYDVLADLRFVRLNENVVTHCTTWYDRYWKYVWNLSLMHMRSARTLDYVSISIKSGRTKKQKYIEILHIDCS